MTSKQPINTYKTTYYLVKVFQLVDPVAARERLAHEEDEVR